MKCYLLYLFFIIAILESGCQFHYIENPGPQISSSVAESKTNHTFLCAYKPNSNRLNGILIDTVFVEKKYYSDGGLFLSYSIDSNNLQLIIVTRDYLVRNGKGFGVDWSMQGFSPHSGKIAYRDYKQKELSDTIVMEMDSISASHSTKITGNLTLYKVK